MWKIIISRKPKKRKGENMIRKLEQILKKIPTVEDTYVFENTIFIYHVDGFRIDEGSLTSLLNTVEAHGFDIDGLTSGFYCHPINDEYHGIFLQL